MTCLYASGYSFKAITRFSGRQEFVDGLSLLFVQMGNFSRVNLGNVDLRLGKLVAPFRILDWFPARMTGLSFVGNVRTWRTVNVPCKTP